MLKGDRDGRYWIQVVGNSGVGKAGILCISEVKHVSFTSSSRVDHGDERTSNSTWITLSVWTVSGFALDGLK